MKFTKGPWEVIKHSWAQTSIMAGPSVICQSDITWECDEDTQDQFEDKQEANAHLIAAAPEMYEELDNLEYFLTQIDPVHFPDRKAARDRIAAVRSVKAKARGEK